MGFTALSEERKVFV